MSANRMRTAVRMLEKTVLILFEADETSVSALQHGRLAVQLRRHVSRLKHLSQKGPEEDFWEELRKATLETVRYVRRIGR